MKNWKAILGITVIFLLGMAAGWLLPRKMWHRPAGREPGGWPRMIERRLARRLDLDGAQRAQLHTIVEDAQKQIRAARASTQPQVREVMDKTENDVRAILRPGQREKYEKILAERKARRQQ